MRGRTASRTREALHLLPLALVLSAASARGATLRRGPYLQLLTARSVTVVWNTDVPAECSLSIAPVGATGVTFIGERATVCAITADGLRPGAAYRYVPNADGVPLRDASTFHADDPGAAFTMLVLGDSGDPGPDQDAVRDRLLATPADLIVHTGDMVYPNGAADDFDPAFFIPYADLLRQMVLWACRGNHDIRTDGGQPWRDAFYTPANNGAASEDYYSFDHGNAHIVVLDSNADIAPGSVQYAFLDADLHASAATWNVVVFHHPVYSSGIVHGSALALRANLVPLFDAHGVDLVFSGHEHNYERTLPLRGGDVVPPGGGTVYITTGGGGRGLYLLPELAYFTAYGESVRHFVRAAVDGDTLTEEMIDAGGAVHDRTTLVKDARASTTSTTGTTTSTRTTTTATTSSPGNTETTTTTMTAPPSCGNCDDGDACTIDRCTAAGDCRHDPVDLEALRERIQNVFPADACAGQRLPARLLRRLNGSRAQIGAAIASTKRSTARRLVVRAFRRLRKARHFLEANVASRLSPACAGAFRERVRVAEDEAACLRTPGAVDGPAGAG